MRRQRARDEAAPSGAQGRRTESLWAGYRRRRTDRARNQLVERYRGLVEAMAVAFATRLPPRIDVQDLMHAGVWGLMRAIEAYRPELGVQFVPFMRHRVRGAMLDELRSQDYLPRLVRHRKRTLEAAESRLRDRLRRPPSHAELAAELEVPESILRRKFLTLPKLSPDQALLEAGRDEEHEFGLDGLVDEHFESPFEELSRRDLLAKIQECLRPVEWKVLRLHYLEGMSGKEVAQKLRLSQSRICQIHGRVLSKLKARLASQQ